MPRVDEVTIRRARAAADRGRNAINTLVWTTDIREEEALDAVIALAEEAMVWCARASETLEVVKGGESDRRRLWALLSDMVEYGND